MSRIVLRGRGDEVPGQGCSDVILVVREALHPQFERRGDDLITCVSIPLVQALTADSISVPMLDGSHFQVRTCPANDLKSLCLPIASFFPTWPQLLFILRSDLPVPCFKGADPSKLEVSLSFLMKVWMMMCKAGHENGNHAYRSIIHQVEAGLLVQ